MPILKTGRNRTIGFTGMISGNIKYWAATGGPGDQFVALTDSEVSVQLPIGTESGYLTLRAYGDPEHAGGGSCTGDLPWTPKWYCYASSGFGTMVTNENDVCYSINHVSGYPCYGEAYHEQSIEGSYSISVDVEEYVEFSTGEWNGNDARPPMYVRVYEVLKQGGTIAASITSGGVTASVTETIDLVAPMEMVYQLSLGAQASCVSEYQAPYPGCGPYWGGHPAGDGVTASITAKYGKTALSAPYTRSATNAAVSAEGGASATVSVPSTSNSVASADIGATLSILREYELDGRVCRLDSLYQGTLGLEADRFNVDPDGHSGQAVHIDVHEGTFGDGYSQRRYACGSHLNGVEQASVNVDEWITYRISARPGAVGDGDEYSLLALGEDAASLTDTDTPLPGQTMTQVALRGWWSTPLRLSHAQSYTVDDCNNAAQEGSTGRWRTDSDNPYGYWKSGDGAAISAPGTDRLRFLASGSDTSVQRYFQLHTDQIGPAPTKTPHIQFSAYAKLAFQIRAIDPDTGDPVDGKTLTVKVATRGYSEGVERVPRQEKRWTLRCRTEQEQACGLAPDGWVTRELDLCGPENVPEGIESEGGMTAGIKVLQEGPPEIYIEEATQTDRTNDQERNTDSRWPGPVLDGWFYGVSVTAFVLDTSGSEWGISIEGLPDGVAIEVRDLSLVRDGLPLVTWCDAYRCWMRDERKDEVEALADPDGAWWLDAEDPPDPPMRSRTHHLRGVLGMVDGRQALEEAAASRSYTLSRDFDTYSLGYSEETGLNLVEDINLVQTVTEVRWCDPHGSGSRDEICTTNHGAIRRNPGWVATETSTSIANRELEDTDPPTMTPEEWMDNLYRPAVWFGGGGWRYTRESTGDVSEQHGTWKHSFDQDASDSNYAPVLQMMFDSIDWYPDCGDLFGFNGGMRQGGPIVLRAAFILQGQGHGIVYNLDVTRRSGKRVQMVEVVEPPPTPPSGAVRGKGVSQLDGTYKTAVPYGKSHVNHYLQPRFADLKPLYRPLYARKRTRACFVTDPDCGDSLFFPDPEAFSPFAAQRGDADLLGIEEWRRGQLVSAEARRKEQGAQPVRAPGHGKQKDSGQDAHGDDGKTSGSPEQG